MRDRLEMHDRLGCCNFCARPIPHMYIRHEMKAARLPSSVPVGAAPVSLSLHSSSTSSSASPCTFLPPPSLPGREFDIGEHARRHRELRTKSPLEKLHARALQLSRGDSVLALTSEEAARRSAQAHEAVYFRHLRGLVAEYLDEILLDDQHD